MPCLYQVTLKDFAVTVVMLGMERWRSDGQGQDKQKASGGHLTVGMLFTAWLVFLICSNLQQNDCICSLEGLM